MSLARPAPLSHTHPAARIADRGTLQPCLAPRSAGPGTREAGRFNARFDPGPWSLPRQCHLGGGGTQKGSVADLPTAA